MTVPPRSLTGSYEEAGACLQKAPRATPLSAAARARWGLLQLKKGDVPAAARDLQCLAEADAQELGFLLQLLEASERQSLTQVRPTEPPPGAPAPRPGRLCPPRLPDFSCGGGVGMGWGHKPVWPATPATSLVCMRHMSHK